MDGRFADARRRWRESKERLTELGLTHTVAVIQMAYGFVELLGTTPELAEPELVGACEAFRRMGDQGRLSSAASILARLLYKEGRLEDSDRYSHVAEDCASEDDIEPQMFWRGTRAKILARAGSSEAAEQLSESAVKLARTTDFPLNQGDALSDHAEVMTLLGRPDDAARALKEAIDAYDRKGICVSVIEARTRLQTLVTDRVEP